MELPSPDTGYSQTEGAGVDEPCDQHQETGPV